MAGLRLVGENPLRYADAETGAKLEVRSLIDTETGRKVSIVFDGDKMSVVQIHVDSLKTTLWKKTLKVSETASDPSRPIMKTCSAAEKTRIESITQKVSAEAI